MMLVPAVIEQNAEGLARCRNYIVIMITSVTGFLAMCLRRASARLASMRT